ATSASRALAKYSTFFGSGFRAGQVGRQKIPVVPTATKNTPLYAASRFRYARSISPIGSCVFMQESYAPPRPLFHPISGADVGKIVGRPGYNVGSGQCSHLAPRDGIVTRSVTTTLAIVYRSFPHLGETSCSCHHPPVGSCSESYSRFLSARLP